MEIDLYSPGSVVYTDKNSLKTSDGTSSKIIAGDTLKWEYIEGKGAEARFEFISGFTQLTDKRLVVADYYNHCLRLIDRSIGTTSAFSGQCKS